MVKMECHGVGVFFLLSCIYKVGGENRRAYVRQTQEHVALSADKLPGSNLMRRQVPRVSKPDQECPTGATAFSDGTITRCCWELRNQKVRAIFSNHPRLQWQSFEHLETHPPQELPVRGSPLIQISGASGEAIAGDDCRLEKVAAVDSRLVVLLLACGSNLFAEFSAQLPNETSHYLRFKVKLWSAVATAQANATKTTLDSLQLFSLSETTKVVEAARQSDLDPIYGLPLVVNDGFFVGVEHPLAVHTVIGRSGVVGKIAHLRFLPTPTVDKPLEYGAVFGAFSEASQARRAFTVYLHTERPGRRSSMVHYNSWFDFYSYQDEGFNGGFTDPNPNETMVSGLRQDVFNESGCLRRVDAFGHELVQKRNIKVDSFLWDDGWDDPHTLWEFDKARFPQGFDVVSAASKSFGAGTGVWLSPWGGYGFPQKNRIKYGRKYGFETNFNADTESESFSLAGPIYRRVFTDVALKFVKEQGVNMFKFDGVAGDPEHTAVEMEAMLNLLIDLRKTSRSVQSRKKNDNGDDDIWINLTTGTWASPFFLLWADSIWRGGPDVGTTMTDWMPDGYRGLGKDVKSDGLSRRQRWIRWRNLMVYLLVVQRSTFFPLSQLMIHGVILAGHGEALYWGLDKFDAIDFAQEVWSFVALGLQLQELYITPTLMTKEAWDILAEGLQWAKREANILRDSYWAFGDPTKRESYCVASWDVASARGFLFVHNPTGRAADSKLFDLASVLELPAHQKDGSLLITTVKSIARLAEGGAEELPPWRRYLKKMARITGRPERTEERLTGWNCELGLEREGEQCTVKASGFVSIRLKPSEVLVLSVSSPVKHS